MRRFRGQLAVVIAFVIIFSVIAPISAQAQVANPRISSPGAVVIDFETGNVLFGRNEAVQRVPASMIKMVAVYVVFDAIRDGLTTMDSRIRISQNVHELSVHPGWANVRLEVGATHTVRELLEIVIVRSANGATAALGEGIFGSDQELVARMNEKAVELNIRASFADSFGISAQNRISPLALAWFMQSLIAEHPQVLEFTSMPNVRWQGGSAMMNTNHLLHRFEGADGLKTGFTNAAQFCLIGTATRDGRRLITVIMGSQTGGIRFEDTETLLNWGFANVARINAAAAQPRRPAANLVGGNRTPQPTPAPEPEPEIPPYEPEIPIDEYPEPEPDPEPTPPEQEPPVEEPPTQLPAPTGIADPSQATLILDGTTMPLSAYLISGSHFFKLRDIAYLLNGTDRQFEVIWDAAANAIRLTSGMEYTPEGGELILAVAGPRPFRPTPSRLYLDGVSHSFDVFLIDGSNFFRLRDLANLIGFEVEWIGQTRTVIISTHLPFSEIISEDRLINEAPTQDAPQDTDVPLF